MKIQIAIRLIYYIGLVVLLTSCKKILFTAGVNCDECHATESDSVDLFVDVTINDKYRKVPIVLYREEVEKGIVDYTDTAFADPYFVYVAVDQEYSVKVQYAYGTDTIFVIDRTIIRMKRVTEECDEDCWVIVKNRIDARLKF